MFCPKCGKQNDVQANYCWNCGCSLGGDNSERNGAGDSSTKVDAVDTAVPQSAPPLDMPSPKKSRAVSAGVAFLVVVVVGVLIWVMVRPPVTVVESTYAKDTSALSRNNTSEESDSVAGDDSQEKEAEEKFKSDSTPVSESVPASEPQDTAPTVPSELEGKEVVWSNVTDYDGDGKQEAFALAGEWFGTAVSNASNVWSQPTLWFISTTGEAIEIEALKPLVYVNDVFADPSGSGYTLLSLELSAGGSGSSSRVFGVRGGSPMEVSTSGRDVQLRNGAIIVGHSFFAPEGGHREEWHEATFDVGEFQLVEGKSLGTTWLRELP